MSVLQPFILAALPLIALPIVIHLINQRRYQTVRWGAMMFLLAANRMSSGYARLRQWLILAFRMLALAGLIFAVSRPLASGWLGMAAGGRADTTIVVLDRSPSMQQQAPGANRTKLAAGVQQLVGTLNLLGSGRWILIDSQTGAPRDLESPDSLLQLPEAEPNGAASDLPAMLEAARRYIATNKTGRTEIWICSDLRRNDWNPDAGRWSALRDSFLEFPQAIRFHLLAYAEPARSNVAVRITSVRRQRTATGGELLLTLLLTREADAEARLKLPVQLEIEGARSELAVEFVGPRYELKDHHIPLDGRHERGWGKVSIPADENPGDNEAFFVFDQPPVRETLIVSDEPAAARPLQLAASISPDPALACKAEVISPEQLAGVDWSRIALVLWHAPLADGEAGKALRDFVERGGQVIFVPPRAPGNEAFLGARWEAWQEGPGETAVESWRGDQDLLANTQSGAALPVGAIQVRRYCRLQGECTPLAQLKGGQPLLARVPTGRGGVYFCATTAAPGDSSLAANGVVLYVLVQRALGLGAAVLGNTSMLVAGEAANEISDNWQQLSGSPQAISTDYAHHCGVYAAEQRLLAINRLAAEDLAPVLADEQLTELFRGLDFARVDDRANNFAALVQEIWRLFLLTMMIALLVEAVLCLPKLTRAAGAAA